MKTFTHRRAGAMAALLLCTLGVSTATAQPNPFDAYEGKKQDPADMQPDRVQQPCDCDTPKAGPSNSALTTQGRWLAGFSGALNWTTTSNDTEQDRIANSTLFIRLAPNAGYFIKDNMEVGAVGGLIWRQIARNDNGASLGRDFFLQARGRYHVHVTERFSLIPGLALGGYLGRNTREFEITEPDGTLGTLDLETRTFGGIAELGVDIGYMLSPIWQLQAGIRGTGLLGVERGEDETFGVRTFNTSLNIGLERYF